MSRFVLAVAGLLLVGLSAAPTADAPPKLTSREALQAFNDLIGSWRAAGLPEGTLAQKQKGAWNETLQWQWQFQKEDTSLKVTFEKGKYWLDGQLRYLPEKDRYKLTLQTAAKETLQFEGTLEKRQLILEREDADKKETQRFIIRLLHENRFLYNYEVKGDGKPSFTRIYQVGATKEGVPFATKEGAGGPECIVSGGPGTIKVTYKGQTYYVCCSGCKSAFLDEPEKFIKEFNDKQKAKEKEKKP